MGKYSGFWGLESGVGFKTIERRRASRVFSEVHSVLPLSSGHLGSILSGFWVGGAIPAALRVLFMAMRTARHRGWAAAEDGLEIATLRAGRVRAAILGFGVGERAERAGGP